MAKKADTGPGPRPERVILLVAGPSGSGKSFFVANLCKALIFDTDLGGGLAYADERIKRNGSERIEVGSYVEVIEELQKRRGKMSNVTTLALDHLSTLHSEAVIRHNPLFREDTFGREHDRAKKEWQKVRDIVRFGDFNLVATAHLKNEYRNKKVVGDTEDASKNIGGDFHIRLHLESAIPGTYPAQANVMKWRRDPEDSRGQVPPSFAFTMENFLKIHGFSMEGTRHEVAMANPEQVAELERLIEIVKLPEGTTEKWLTKAKAESWSELSEETIAKCIDHLRSLVAQPAAPKISKESAA